MLRSYSLLLPLAATALLTAGTAHAEAHRAAQSLPGASRFNPPAPPKASREEPARGQFTRSRTPEGEAYGNRSRNDPGHYDNRRYDIDRDDYERAKEREGHHFGHHGHGDSPGC